MTRFRGSPERPGLMMALDGGGSCEGVAYRLPAKCVDEALTVLIKREMPFAVSGMKARWMPLRTSQGPLHAVGFVVNRAACDYVPSLTEDQVVASLQLLQGVRARWPNTSSTPSRTWRRTASMIVPCGICKIASPRVWSRAARVTAAARMTREVERRLRTALPTVAPRSTQVCRVCAR